MALNEQQRKVIVDNFDELFANPRALGNELAMNDNYTYGEIVKEGLQEEGFPDEADHTNVFHDLELKNNSDDETWCDLYEQFHGVESNEDFEPIKDDEGTYYDVIFDNLEKTEADVMIHEEITEWLDENPSTTYLAEKIESNWDTVQIEELIPTHSPHYEDDLKEAIQDDGFPQDANIDEIETGFLDVKPSSSYEDIADQLLEQATLAGSVENYVKDTCMLDIVTNELVSYEIEILSDPEDFQ